MPEEPGEQAQVDTKPAKSPRILLWGIVAISALSAGVGGGFLTSRRGGEKDNTKPEATFALEEFTANLADLTEPHYLRVTMVLGLKNEKLEEEMDKRTPEIRDAILSVLGSKHYAELLPVEGHEKLKKEIVARLAKVLGKGKVIEIYLTSFAIQ